MIYLSDYSYSLLFFLTVEKFLFNSIFFLSITSWEFLSNEKLEGFYSKKMGRKCIFLRNYLMSHLEILYIWNPRLTIRHLTIFILICQSNASKRLNNLTFHNVLAKLGSCWWEERQGNYSCLTLLEFRNEVSIKLFLILLWNKHYGHITHSILDNDAYILKKAVSRND